MRPAAALVQRAVELLAERHAVRVTPLAGEAWRLDVDGRLVLVCRSGPRDPAPYVFVLGQAEPRDETDAPTGSALAEAIELHLARRA